MNSSDGINWSTSGSNALPATTWTSVCWSPELSLFVTVAQSSLISSSVATSPNGLTWTTRPPTTPSAWSSVCWSPQLSLFAAVGWTTQGQSLGLSIMYSTSGLSWTSAAASTTSRWSSIAWSPALSQFVAVSEGTTTTTGVSLIQTSDTSFPGMNKALAIGTKDTSNVIIDGKNVTIGKNASTVTIGQYSNDVIVGKPGNQTTMRGLVDFSDSNSSLDVYNNSIGVTTLSTIQNIATNTWTLVPVINSTTKAFSSIIWAQNVALLGSGIFVAVSSNGTNSPHTLYSYDGITWNTASVARVNNWNDIAWSEELQIMVTVSYSGTNTVMYSKNGINWTTANTNTNCACVCWSPDLGLFVAPGSSTNTGITSPDGINWTAMDNLQSSREKIVWASSLGMFYSIGGNSSTAVYSFNGINWTNTTLPEASLVSLEWSPELGIFVYFPNVSSVRAYKSNNGITWSTITVPQNTYYSIIWSPQLSMFCACGITSTIIKSADGTNWTTVNSSSSILTPLRTIAWSPTLSVFVAGSNTPSGTIPRLEVTNNNTYPGITKNTQIGSQGLSTLSLVGNTLNIGNTADTISIGRYAQKITIADQVFTKPVFYFANLHNTSPTTFFSTMPVFDTNVYSNGVPILATTASSLINGGYILAPTASAPGGRFYAPVSGVYAIYVSALLFNTNILDYDNFRMHKCLETAGSLISDIIICMSTYNIQTLTALTFLENSISVTSTINYIYFDFIPQTSTSYIDTTNTQTSYLSIYKIA
jgi:hypothetical protein